MATKCITLTESELNSLIKKCVKESLSKMDTLKENSKGEFHLKCKKVTSENEDVMKKYWNINRKGNYAPILLEKITIDRLMKKHGNNGFIIISANRSDESEEYNVQNTQELITDLKSSKYSYLPVYGGYKGTDGVTDKYEPSFIVFNYDKNGEPKNWEQLRNFAIYLCDKYAQDSVFVQGPNESPNYLDANGNQTNSRSSKNIIKNDLNQEYFTSFSSGAENEKHGKTQPIGRRFTSDIVFNEIYVNPMPCTITERMRREGEILVY